MKSPIYVFAVTAVLIFALCPSPDAVSIPCG